MAKILIVDGGVQFHGAGGTLNHAYAQLAQKVFAAMGHEAEITRVADDWNAEAEAAKFKAADAVLLTFAAWWMGTPWPVKRYIDEVFCAGLSVGGDGRTRTDPAHNYGRGGVLTDKQRAMMDAYYDLDCSLAEIADEYDISRQAVRDNIKRAETALFESEEKFGILKTKERLAEKIEKLKKLLSEKGFLDDEIRLALEETAKEITVPYIGPMLTSLVYVNDGNTSKKTIQDSTETFWNMVKFRGYAQIMREIESDWGSAMQFVLNPELFTLISSMAPPKESDGELFQKARQLRDGA